MPYQTLDQLPTNVKSKYSDKAQRAYLAAFNAILAQTNDETRAIAGAHMAANKADGIFEKIRASETMDETFAEATWDTAYINTLPDSSFAYVEPGGTKDAEGKTEPRSLRHFPYKDSSGTVNLPHLRNALARAPQSPIGPSAMPKLQAAAKAENVGIAKECSFWLEANFQEVEDSSGHPKAKVTIIKPGVSGNNYYYSSRVLSGLVPLMEGAKAYLDHETKSEIKDRGSRSVKDLIGWYENVAQDSEGAVTADLNFIPGKADWITEAVRINPSLVGLSINARGQASRGKIDSKNVLIAESFDKVYSTDVVTEPAAKGAITQMVASMTIEQDEEVWTMQESEQATWLLAETRYKVDVATWLAQEKTNETVSAHDKVKAIEQESEKREILKDVPEKFHESLMGLEPEQMKKLVEVMKSEPATAKTEPAAPEVKGPGPGDAGFKRNFL